VNKTRIHEKKNKHRALSKTRMSQQTGLNHAWFQSHDWVEIDIRAKRVPAECVHVDFTQNSVHVVIDDNSSVGAYEETFRLSDGIVPDRSSFQVLGTKVEVRLAKAVPGVQWACLTTTDASTSVDPAVVQMGSDQMQEQGVGTTHNKGKDWNAIEREIAEDEASQKSGGDDVMGFFRTIFANADEDTKRAMMKSYVESGGKALSTNWEDVGSKDYASSVDT
jgi:suppressor of G2 allele of SKP1